MIALQNKPFKEKQAKSSNNMTRDLLQMYQN